MQLDMFTDGRETMLLNDVVFALKKSDFRGADAAKAYLEQAYPENAFLCDIEVVQSIQDIPRSIGDQAEMKDVFEWVDRQLTPAAQRLFSQSGEAWLADNAWSCLALAAEAMPYSPRNEAPHSAQAWMRAGRWEKAVAAIEAIPSWRTSPLPLGWMVISKFRLRAPEAWGLLMELAWIAPGEFKEVAKSINQPALTQILRDFDATFGDDEVPYCWLPALVVVSENPLVPLVRNAMPATDSDATRAFRCLLDLLVLEKQGRQTEIGAKRSFLRSLSGALYLRYMRDR